MYVQATTPYMEPTWPKTDMHWSVVPWGFKELLLWCHKRYNAPHGILVTENGCAVHEPDEASAVDDQFRVAYLTG
jgi:beta-glucosidase/6-phospho-beta-glucosidase/beta-galactosidase